MKNIQDQKPGEGFSSKNLLKVIFVDNISAIIVTLVIIGIVIYILVR